jgi:flagellar protein FliO/FliZ
VRKLRKKNILGVLLGLLLFLMVSPYTVYADGDTVKDMFDKGEPTEQEEKVDPTNDQSPNFEEGNGSNTGDEALDNGSLAFDLIKMVFALFLILALIYILLKFLNKRNKIFNQVKALENLGGIAVGPSKSIQIIRVGNKLYLVGVGENVQLLEEISDEEMKVEILKSYQEQPEFKAENILSLFQRKTKENTEEINKQPTEFKNLFTNELEKLKQNRRNLMNKHTEKEDNHE